MAHMALQAGTPLTSGMEGQRLNLSWFRVYGLGFSVCFSFCSVVCEDSKRKSDGASLRCYVAWGIQIFSIPRPGEVKSC